VSVRRRGFWRGAILAAAILFPGIAHAQRPVAVYVEAGAMFARIRSRVGTAAEPLEGLAREAGAGLSGRGLSLEARYAEGMVTSENAGVEDRDVTEGEVLLGVSPHRLVTLKVGPHARAYRSDAGTRRWVFWEGRVRATAPIIPSRLDAYTELWAAVAGSTSLSTSFVGERGGEVGATLEIPRTPLAARVAYRIDRGRGDSPTRSDTAEQVLLAVRARLR
jgi:hypothetical protein